MPKHRNALLVIADGEHARFVRPGPDNALHDAATLDSLNAHKRSTMLGSDRPGASFHSDSTQHHAEAPRHDPHDLEKGKFAQLVADQLNAGANSGEFDELIIVAPSHALAAIRQHLNALAAAKIVGMLQKDLVKTPNDQLWPHVREWFSPSHRPGG